MLPLRVYSLKIRFPEVLHVETMLCFYFNFLLFLLSLYVIPPFLPPPGVILAVDCC